MPTSCVSKRGFGVVPDFGPVLNGTQINAGKLNCPNDSRVGLNIAKCLNTTLVKQVRIGGAHPYTGWTHPEQLVSPRSSFGSSARSFDLRALFTEEPLCSGDEKKTRESLHVGYAQCLKFSVPGRTLLIVIHTWLQPFQRLETTSEFLLY